MLLRNWLQVEAVVPFLCRLATSEGERECAAELGWGGK